MQSKIWQVYHISLDYIKEIKKILKLSLKEEQPTKAIIAVEYKFSCPK